MIDYSGLICGGIGVALGVLLMLLLQQMEKSDKELVDDLRKADQETWWEYPDLKPWDIDLKVRCAKCGFELDSCFGWVEDRFVLCPVCGRKIVKEKNDGSVCTGDGDSK